MNRWLMIGSVVGLLVMSTGCLHHNARKGCNSAGSCQSCGDCNGCNSSSGLLGKLGGGCKGAACPTSCVPGPLGWQQGGMKYGANICPHGGCQGAGHGAGHGAGAGAGLLGHGAAAQIQNQPFTPGPPSAQVGYPYYTHRGPRDFLLDNPPSIGR